MSSAEKLRHFLRQDWKQQQEEEAIQANDLDLVNDENMLNTTVHFESGTGLGSIVQKKPYYRGYFVFTAGSTTVTGIDTNFLDDSDEGLNSWYGFYLPDGSNYFNGDIGVDTITSNTAFELDAPWDKESMTTKAIIPMVKFCTSSNRYTIALGNGAVAKNFFSVAIGDSVTSTSQSSLATGKETYAGGNFSYAHGYQSKTTGANSHAEGSGCLASAENSHAEGLGTTASNVAAHSEGLYTNAAGMYSLALGNRCFTNWSYTIAMGASTTASNAQAFSSGQSTSAGAVNCSTIGGSANTIHASATNAVVLGGKNIAATAADTAYASEMWIAKNGGGIIMQSPNGTKYKLTVADNGTLTATAV